MTLNIELNSGTGKKQQQQKKIESRKIEKQENKRKGEIRGKAEMAG